ncbi:hypothetical protein PVA45_03580 [Entomospira entomophila]|uniref:Uncharacterized protein n=1 Tax=Entomospira entomophila TaxID=2719988 RepID=A0A968KSQ7_9SPIO|nr:hypothetical protein [Entomospira entomophilus]NIZ40592.1 hypothetical protein [Entomospira entomophilus]WDI34807.1 hypothetical protein PVA45_03580 [Entomospira entomophilus]
MHVHKLTKITLIVNHALIEDALHLLQELKSPYVLLQIGRSTMIPPQKFWRNRIKIKDEQQSILECYVPYDLELFYLQKITDELSLLTPGRGSVWSQAVNLYTSLYEHAELDANSLKKAVIEQLLSTEMHIITLVSARDEANAFSQTLLSRGYPSPIIHYGTGMGTRSRMGLLRITIPPEKEILRLPIHYKDSRFVLQLLAHQARLDLPGKGFLTHAELRYAKINTKTHIDDPSRLASIEQIISAIDTLQGGIEWRRKHIEPLSQNSPLKENALIELTFIGLRGVSEAITQIAFELGGRGATMVRKRFYSFGIYKDEFGETHERETCNIALTADIASKLILHVIQYVNWQEIGLSAIEEHPIQQTFA